MESLYHQLQKNLFLIAGPCAVEDEATCMEIADAVKQMCTSLGITYIFKASYRKANRSRLDSFTGIGDIKALEIIARVGVRYDLPTTTDIHSVEEAKIAADYVDILQIPAFLCRQTDLLVAAAKTGKIVNIKKGQFLSAEAMQFAVNKVLESGNEKVVLTERGTTFGYHDLVVDFRGIPIMQKMNHPVVLDCTHSMQKPNTVTGITGGVPEHIETIAKAGVAVGVNGLFIETHPNPSIARSDGANMLPLNQLGSILNTLVKIRAAVNK